MKDFVKTFSLIFAIFFLVILIPMGVYLVLNVVPTEIRQVLVAPVMFLGLSIFGASIWEIFKK